MTQVSNPSAVFANLVRNGMSLAQVPEKYRREVEIIVASNDITFDLNGELTNAASSPVVEYKTRYDFPNIGIGNRLYIDQSQNISYRWNSSSMRYDAIIGDSIQDIKVINGGNSDG